MARAPGGAPVRRSRACLSPVAAEAGTDGTTRGDKTQTIANAGRTARIEEIASRLRRHHDAPRRGAGTAVVSRIPSAVRRRVRRRARGLCEYCRSRAELTGHEFTVDHVVPESLRGSSRLDNLCWCCFWCNSFKQAQTEGLDSRTRSSHPYSIRVSMFGMTSSNGARIVLGSWAARRLGGVPFGPCD